MNKKVAKIDRFAVFIFCWGRPHFCDTLNTLRKCGYNGRVYLLLDNLDETRHEYIKVYGNEMCYVFDKRRVARTCDPMNNFGKYESTLFVENVMFDIAKDLHLDYFCAMCDDYYYFGHRGEHGAKRTSHLDLVFSYILDYLEETPIKCIAFSQGGDNMGGFDPNRLCKRKVMNSFICKTNEPFKFYGLMNDDANMYICNGIRGDIFLTLMRFQLDQKDTQSESGGLSNLYKNYGTYVKSFYSVMLAPSCVKVRQMGRNSKRLHHSITWEKLVPCIVSEDYKKK